MILNTGTHLVVLLSEVDVQCKDGQMEIGSEAAEQLGICRLDDDHKMKWRNYRYIFAITQARGVLYADGNTILVFLNCQLFA